MDTHPRHDTNAHVAERVRACGMSAAIGAACLLYFGFARLLEPNATDLFSTSWLILYHTARWGGVLMAGIALWLWSGHVVAMLADGVIATLIGVLLVVTGLGMGVDGGGLFQTLINFFCGYMFYSSGVQNGRDYFRLTKNADALTVNDARGQTIANVKHETTLREIFVPEPTAPAPRIEARDPEIRTPKLKPVVEPESVPDSKPPTGGYLASFAKKDPNKDA